MILIKNTIQRICRGNRICENKKMCYVYICCSQNKINAVLDYISNKTSGMIDDKIHIFNCKKSYIRKRKENNNIGTLSQIDIENEELVDTDVITHKMSKDKNNLIKTKIIEAPDIVDITEYQKLEEKRCKKD